MAKVLLTGGAGFIGSHVADAYIARGDSVWVLDDLSAGRRENVPAQATFIHMSLQDDRLNDVFVDAGGFDIVSHHAAQPDVRRSVADPRYDCSVNIDGLLNVLECVRRHGARRVMFVSSGGVVYGEPELRPTPESAAKAPLSPYGVAKLTGEFYLYYYARVHGMDYVALRYANIYGPRQDPHGEAGVVAIFASRLRDAEPLTIFGDGAQTRDYTYVGDVVGANMLLTDLELPSTAELDSRAFNVGTGIETSVIDLANAVMQVSGHELPVRHEPERRGELRHSSLDARKLKQLGWSPRTSLHDGLRATYEWIASMESAR
jgi:UDP-glucose 4-epimerase